MNNKGDKKRANCYTVKLECKFNKVDVWQVIDILKH